MVGEDIVVVLLGVRLVVVVDKIVVGLYMEVFGESLIWVGLDYIFLMVLFGESMKCFFEFEWLCDEVLVVCLECGDVIVVLGGGVVGDFIGFVVFVVCWGMVFV